VNLYNLFLLFIFFNDLIITHFRICNQPRKKNNPQFQINIVVILSLLNTVGWFIIKNDSMLREIQTIILDTLFPIKCLSCGKNGVWICEKCIKNIKVLPSQVCPYCEKSVSPSGKICNLCKEKFLKSNKLIPLNNLIVATTYKKSGIFRLIHLFKYRFISDLSKPFGNILIKSIIENNLPLPDLIVPIPLHK